MDATLVAGMIALSSKKLATTTFWARFIRRSMSCAPQCRFHAPTMSRIVRVSK